MYENVDGLRVVLNILRRRKMFILYFVSSIVIITVLTLISLPPQYTASTSLYLKILGEGGIQHRDNITSAGFAHAVLDSEVEVIRSDTIQLSTYDDLKLIHSNEFGASLSVFDKIKAFVGGVNDTSNPDEVSGSSSSDEVSGSSSSDNEAYFNRAFDRFKSKIEIKRKGLTFLIQISATSKTPELAAKIANHLAKTHIDLKLKKSLEESLNAKKLLEKRINTTRLFVEEAEQELQTFIESNLDEILLQTSDHEIQSLKSSLEFMKETDLKRLRLTKRLETNRNSLDLDNLTSDLMSEGLKAALQKRQNLINQIDGASEVEKTDLESVLEKLETQLDTLIAEELTNLAALAQNASKELSDLEKKLRDRVFAIDLPPSILTKLYQIRTSADVARGQYEKLVTSATELQTQLEVQTSDIVIVSPAMPPHRPSYPDIQFTLILILILSIGLSIGIALLMDQYIGGINSMEQLEDILSKPVISAIPTYQSKSRENSSANNIFKHLETNPTSSFAESIRKIRTEIDLQSLKMSKPEMKSDADVILVTSSVPGEGKSIISTCLAKSFSMCGNKTLLIDADLRGPTIHRILNVEGRQGLLDFLHDPKAVSKLKPSMINQFASNFDLCIGKRQVDIDPNATLHNNGFGLLINTCKTLYETIVIDTSPLLPVADTNYLLRYVDFSIFVVSFGSTSQKEVRRANIQLNKYKKENSKVFTVLNKTDRILQDYLYEH